MKILMLSVVNGKGYCVCIPTKNILFVRGIKNFWLGHRTLVKLINGEKFYSYTSVENILEEIRQS